MYKEILPSRLKEARKITGFTQREIAKETGIHHVSIARYESGQREPDIETLGTLSAFYDVSVDWLLGLARKQNTEKYHTEQTNRNSILKDIEKEAKKVI